MQPTLVKQLTDAQLSQQQIHARYMLEGTDKLNTPAMHVHFSFNNVLDKDTQKVNSEAKTASTNQRSTDENILASSSMCYSTLESEEFNESYISEEATLRIVLQELQKSTQNIRDQLISECENMTTFACQNRIRYQQLQTIFAGYQELNHELNRENIDLVATLQSLQEGQH